MTSVLFRPVSLIAASAASWALGISVTFKRGTIRSSIAAQNEPRIDTTPMTAAA